MRAILPRAMIGCAALGLVAFAPGEMDRLPPDCPDGLCRYRLTAPQLLAEIERLVQERRFDEARPLLEALAHAPELHMETNFLRGYVAAETGDLPGAARFFRAVLRDRPDITRARLELARVLMMDGKDAAADHHYRLAEQDANLPPEISRTIRDARGLLRDRKTWHVNIDVGLAPDSNINNGTDTRSIDVPFGGGTLPFQLDEDAKPRKGVGQFATVSTGVKLRLKDGLALLVDADGQIINQKGGDADDISALLAIGPEVTTKSGTRITVQATGVQRWFGGTSATTGGGARVSVQKNLSRGARAGVQIDSRYVTSGFGRHLDGWQHALNLSYERIIDKRMVASVVGFARREDLRAAAFSNTEVGGMIGIGGELPMGLNAGVSGMVSRATYDAPFLSLTERKDWRYSARAYLGTRAIRVMGFSPSLTYTFNKVDSTNKLYQTDRHRVQFALARYF
jgi:hypothetical protein